MAAPILTAGARRPWSLLRPRLRAPSSTNESLRIERVISVARLLLAAIALIQVRLDPIDPPNYGAFALLFLIAFAAHSTSALLVLRTRQTTSQAFVLTTATLDLLSAAMTLPMAAPTNSFFVFFLFIIAATAFRWGFRETVAITLLSIGLVLLHANIAPDFQTLSVGWLGNVEFDRTIGRIAYLTMIGLLLGYLAEEGRLLRAEAAAVARLLGRIRVDAGLTRAAVTAAMEVLALFNASRLLLVVEDRETQRLFRWDTAGGWGMAPATSSETDKPDKDTFFFSPPHLAFALTRRLWPLRMRSPYHAIALDSMGRAVDGVKLRVPAQFVKTLPFRRLISVPVTFGDEWSGRLFLFDPRLDMRVRALTQFVQTIVRQVGPAMFSVHLTGQLQERAGAIERARVARELHDGVIQSLIGVEMQIDVLRRQQVLSETSAGAELSRIQQLVKSEVLNLRELMQAMQPPDFDPDELIGYLADMVQRFGRDSGIAATFLSEVKDVRLPWRVCFELVRIVQEGLVNVRKHSGATNVVVRFGVRDGHWALEINDNGRGFPFAGRLTHGELDVHRRGPTVIKERVKAIGGQLALDSTPGHGTRLEVLVPQETHG